MSLRLNAALRGDLEGFLAGELKAGNRAVGSVMRRHVTKLKQDVRAAIAGAGLGARLGNAIRGSVVVDRNVPMNTRGRVASTALYKRPGGLVDLITVFQEGATITARGGKYLAIPVGAGKKEKLENLKSEDIELLPFRNGKGFVVLRRGARGFGRGGGGVLFLLVKQVRIKPRLSLDGLADAASAGIEDEIVAEWEKQAG